MSYKIIVLGPAASGKSTLMKYLRKRTDLRIVEMDEEVTKANDGEWPSDNEYKDRILVPEIAEDVLKEDRVVYIASYMPTELVRKAKQNGFKVALLRLEREQFAKRNARRVEAEGYDDASPWFQKQLEYYQELNDAGLIDEIIDAQQPIGEVADKVLQLTRN